MTIEYLQLRCCAYQVVAFALLLLVCPTPGVTQENPQFRSGITLVPLDVRVIDRKGNPVTDLNVADFVLYENGVKQQIVHFARIIAGADRATGSLLDSENPLSGAANPYRTFIFVLGTGRLNGPVRGIEALVDFVGRRLLATDRVGIVAYLRGSDPSNDHAAIRRFLEAYRKHHEAIEGSMLADFRRALDRAVMSQSTRERIDALFSSPHIPSFAPLPGATGNNINRFTDLGYVRWAIEKASRIPGEKHVVVLAQHALGLSHISEERERHVLVRWAASARVALSYINTGGVSGHSIVRGQVVIPVTPSGDANTSILGISDGDFFAPGEHRVLAEQTGGLSSYYQYAARTLDLLDRSSRFQYLLGYYPSVSSSPSAYRRLRVEVNRRDVVPLYRHGYQLQAEETDVDDFRAAVAAERLDRSLGYLVDPPLSRRTFGHYFRPRTTLKITPQPATSAAQSAVAVTLALDPTMIAFIRQQSRYRAQLQMAIVVDSGGEEIAGRIDQPITIDLSEDEHARISREWLSFDVMVPIQGPTRRIRAAVYDYDSDRVLSAMIPYQPKK